MPAIDYSRYPIDPTTVEIIHMNYTSFLTASDREGRYWFAHVGDEIETGERIRIVNAIKRRGYINLVVADWQHHTPYGSDAYVNDGFEERQIEDERDGLG